MPTDPRNTDAARARLREATDIAAVRTHPGYETISPPMPHGGTAVPYRPPQPSLVDTLEKHGRGWSAAQKIVVGIVAVCGALGAIATGAASAFRWAVERAVFESLAAERAHTKEEIAAATKEILPLAGRVRAVERRESKDDQRWDRLDSWHARQKRAPSTAPPPKFGPAAEKRGEVRFDDPEDE